MPTVNVAAEVATPCGRMSIEAGVELNASSLYSLAEPYAFRAIA
jgi:hypothetical protein